MQHKKVKCETWCKNQSIRTTLNEFKENEWIVQQRRKQICIKTLQIRSFCCYYLNWNEEKRNPLDWTGLLIIFHDFIRLLLLYCTVYIYFFVFLCKNFLPVCLVPFLFTQKPTYISNQILFNKPSNDKC